MMGTEETLAQGLKILLTVVILFNAQTRQKPTV
jgi:hypothetical protein